MAETLLEERFAGGVLPAGWTRTALSGTGNWTFRNTPFFASSSAGNYAVFDDQALGPVTGNHAFLQTPSINCLGHTQVFLRYQHHWFGVEFTHGYVELSNDGGSTWITLVDYHQTTRGSLAAPQDTTLNLTALAANQSDVRIRFRYTDGGVAGRFWYLDDILVFSEPDLAVDALVLPPRLGCNQAYGNAEAVSVRIINRGRSPLSNVPLSCAITGGLTANLSGVFAGPLNGGDTAIFVFPGTVNLGADAVYHFQIINQLATDAYRANDTMRDSRRQRVQTYPYVENFNAGNGDWEPGSNVNTGERRFRYGPLPYLGGPQGQGRSWYVESTTGTSNAWIWLESPVFDFSGLTSPQISMDIKHQLHYWDYFRVEYSLNGGTSWTVLGTNASPNWYNHNTSWWRDSRTNPVNQWTRVQHNLCALAGQACVKLRIYGQPYYGSPTYPAHEYFAVDNIRIEEGRDVGVTAFLAPLVNGCLYSDTQALTIRVFNGSCSSVSNVAVSCQVSGPNPALLSGVVPGPISVGGFVDYTFPTRIDMRDTGTYQFLAYTQDPFDINRANDTIQQSIYIEQVRIQTFPYLADFNGNTQYWRAGASPNNGQRSFRHGNLPYLNGPQGQGQSWYVESTTGTSSAWIWLESPVFDFSNLTNPKLLFQIKHRLHYWDYFRLEYSTNGGTSWTPLGTSSSSPSWYNHSSNWWRESMVNTVNEWTTMEHTLCNLAGQSCVKFRFYGQPYYGSPTYLGHEYFAIDNFHITNTPIDASVNFIQSCFGSNYGLDVTVVNENYLCQTSPTITSIDLSYRVNGGSTQTQTFTGLNIPFGSAQTVRIPNVNVPNASSQVQVWCSRPNGLDDHIYENDTAWASSSIWPHCNDHCSHAIQLGLGSTTATQNSFATVNPAEDPNFSGCGSLTIENTVWYYFQTDSFGGDVNVFFENTACSPSTNGIQVSIDELTGGTPCQPSSYTNRFCANPGNQDTIKWNGLALPPNRIYYITVDGFAGNNCNFDIRIDGAVNVILNQQALQRWRGEHQNPSHLLYWDLAPESGYQYMELLSSTNGFEFQHLALLPVEAQIHYHYRDEQPQPGWTYYRLKLYRPDGSYQFSSIISLWRAPSSQSNLKLYPNPSRDWLVLEGMQGPGQWRVLNALGQTLMQGQSQGASLRLEFADELPEGAYWLQWQGEHQAPEVLPFSLLRP